MKILRLVILIAGCALLAIGLRLLYLRSHSSSSDEPAPISVKISRSTSERAGQKPDSLLQDSTVPEAEVLLAGEESERKDVAAPTPPYLLITTDKLPMGVVGLDYRQLLTSAGAEGRPLWKIGSGELPPGLEFEQDGVVVGIPRQTGEWTFTVLAADEKGNLARKEFRLLIRPATAEEEAAILSIVTASIPEGFLGRAYLQNIECKGGEPPYRWTLSGGVLPELIQINIQTGVLYGTPREVGKFPFTLRLTDSAEMFVEKNFILEVKEGTIEIVTEALPPASKGEKYSLTFRAQGGMVPYRWKMVTGNPPEGLEFDSERGIISGTPEKWETATFLLRVTGQEGRSAEKEFKLEVTAAVQRITDLRIVTDSLPNAVRGELYNAELTAADGSLPYIWTVSQGDLPPSLSLDSGTGLISGIPEEAGKTSFTVLVSDETSNVAYREFSLTVDYQLVYITTGTLEIAVVGSGYQQSIAVTGGTPPYTFQLESGELPADLSLDSVSGQILGTISENYFGQEPQEFTFRIKATDQAGHYDIVELKMTVRDTAEPTPLFSPTPQPSSSPTPIPTLSPVGFHISTAALPEGIVGEKYEITLSALGGTTPYTWSFQNLPGGLSGSSDSGTISGKPLVAAGYSVMVLATDTEGEVASKTFVLSIFEVQGISDLIGAAGDGKIGLAWTNPGSSDFDEVKVLRKTGSYPVNDGDGTIIYEGTGDNILDDNLTNNVTYFYAVITFNDDGTSGGVGPGNRIEITPLEVSISGKNDPYADEVISFRPLSSGGSGSSAVLGSPRGEGKDKGSLDVVSLHARVYDGTSPCGGSITLKFNDNLVWNGDGDDFTIFENVFDIGGDEAKRWMEPTIVAVSQDGKTYYTFPYDYVPHYDGDELDYYNPYSYMDGDGAVRGFAGIHPVFSNNGTPDPTNPSVSGGDSFDLEDITEDLSWIQYIKITATGDGWLTDRNGDSVRHVQDMGACSGAGSSGFDLDAVSAVNY